ncbi:hypothetical protein C8J57DRAFT_1249934 [Mycena rebaudengoi]|nr:hypothetical protein C8J57DRAFT_1249934 [Mycena rebaudengoi]
MSSRARAPPLDDDDDDFIALRDAVAQSSPIAPRTHGTSKRTHGAMDDDEDAQSATEPGSSTAQPVALSNQNIVVAARRNGDKKRLRTDQLTEIDILLNHLFKTRNFSPTSSLLVTKSIKSSRPSVHEVSPELDTNIHKYAPAVLLSSKINSYKSYNIINCLMSESLLSRSLSSLLPPLVFSSKEDLLNRASHVLSRDGVGLQMRQEVFDLEKRCTERVLTLVRSIEAIFERIVVGVVEAVSVVRIVEVTSSATVKLWTTESFLPLALAKGLSLEDGTTATGEMEPAVPGDVVESVPAADGASSTTAGVPTWEGGADCNVEGGDDRGRNIPVTTPLRRRLGRSGIVARSEATLGKKGGSVSHGVKIKMLWEKPS